MGIVLRDYQEEALRLLREGCATKTSQIVVMATGLGKTMLAAEFMRRWDVPGDILFLAHRIELIEQTAATYKRLTGEHAEIEMGDQKVEDLPMYSGARVIVASIQSLAARLHNERFDPKRFSLIIVDECHHGTASSYLKILHHFGILTKVDPLPGKKKKNFIITPAEESHCRCVGLTATPKRTDKEAMDQIFGPPPAFIMNIWKAVKQEGWLVDIRQKAIVVEGLELDTLKCRRNDAGDIDFTGKELEKVMSEEGPLHEVVDVTIREVGDRQTIVFASGVDHAKLLESVFNRRKDGIARAIYGDMDDTIRSKRTEAFKNGTLQILINVMICTEGFDHPDTACVVMARPTKSLLVYTQCLGRGTRPKAGVLDGLLTPQERIDAIKASAKPDVLVLDFVGNSTKHKLIDAVDVLGGEHSVELRDRVKEHQKANPGGSVNDALDKVTEEMKEEIEARFRDERRKKLKLLANYYGHVVSPFEVGGKTTTKHVNTETGGATLKQIEALVKMGISEAVANGYGKKQAGAILCSLREKKCSKPQAYQLKRHGHNPDNYNFHQASEILNQLIGSKEFKK